MLGDLEQVKAIRQFLKVVIDPYGDLSTSSTSVTDIMKDAGNESDGCLQGTPSHLVVERPASPTTLWPSR